MRLLRFRILFDLYYAVLCCGLMYTVQTCIQNYYALRAVCMQSILLANNSCLFFFSLSVLFETDSNVVTMACEKKRVEKLALQVNTQDNGENNGKKKRNSNKMKSNGCQ